MNIATEIRTSRRGQDFHGLPVVEWLDFNDNVMWSIVGKDEDDLRMSSISALDHLTEPRGADDYSVRPDKIGDVDLYLLYWDAVGCGLCHFKSKEDADKAMALIASLTAPKLPDTGTAFLVRIGPGCGCCPHEARIEGPYHTREAAEKRKEQKENWMRQERRDPHVSVREWPYELIHRTDGKTWIALGESYLVRSTFIELRGSEGPLFDELESFAELHPGV